MIHPVVCNPVISPLVGILNPSRWRAGRNAPLDSILHWDADIDAFSEQTGGVHTFNHAVLSPQYQRNADGSYVDVGAKPAVDVFDGKKWLRSCGVVTNLLTNSVFEGAVSGSPGTAPTGWSYVFSGGQLAVNDTVLTFSATAQRHVLARSVALSANTTYRFQADVVTSGGLANGSLLLAVSLPADATTAYEIDGVASSQVTRAEVGAHSVSVIITVASTGGTAQFRVGIGCDTTATGTVTISNPQLTATAYPQPYVPTTAAGPVTQPASNATTTNGSWFSLPDGSPLWQALTGQPLTLATRVRMGVGSADLPNSTDLIVWSPNNQATHTRIRKDTLGDVNIRAYDGLNTANSTNFTLSRFSIWRVITQVNTAGTQFRTGGLIEGAHTEIQWQTTWAKFDGSFNPSTLYRLMLGYNNAYPMWFNKITAWKKQATDAEILEAWS